MVSSQRYPWTYQWAYDTCSAALWSVLGRKGSQFVLSPEYWESNCEYMLQVIIFIPNPVLICISQTLNKKQGPSVLFLDEGFAFL
jgi:hypothetical protein